MIEPQRWTHFRRLHAAVWAASLALWTFKLLDPQPVPPQLQPEPAVAFALAKTLHVCGYLWCTFLGLWLWQGLTWRIVFAGIMVWHAILTEIIQGYIPTRFGSEKDVGFNVIGITFACLLTYWRNRHQSRR